MRETRNGILKITSKKGEVSYYPSTEELCRVQVEWYRKHGQHPQDRIARCGHGIEYVIGDQSWNHRRDRQEFIEPYLPTIPQRELARRFQGNLQSTI